MRDKNPVGDHHTLSRYQPMQIVRWVETKDILAWIRMDAIIMSCSPERKKLEVDTIYFILNVEHML